MNSKTKILAIVPYEGMKRLIKQIAESRTDVEIIVYVGDLKQGANIALELSGEDFDVIISRGGTAEMIRETSHLPVVEIPLSLYDILRAVKLAENGKKKYSIVGFPTITKNAKAICDVLQLDSGIHTIHNEAEAELVLTQLLNQQYDMVLCDMITHSLSQKQGIPAILITSGAESIIDALDTAIATHKTYMKINTQIKFFQSILSKRTYPTYVFKENGEIIFESDNQKIPEQLINYMKNMIDSILQNTKQTLYCDIEKKTYYVTGSAQYINEEVYVLFEYAQRKRPSTSLKSSISYSGKEEAYDKFFNSFYGITQSTSILSKDINHCTRSRDPVMIVGEQGTGKEHMLRLIYAKSRLSSNPLITVNCLKINEKEWKFLLESEESPLMDINNSLYFCKLNELSEKRFTELISVISEHKLHQLNQFYFTETLNNNGEISIRGKKLINHFSCTTINMPPLRENRENIANLASIYISTLNISLVKEVIGFEPKALRLLEQMDWPYNYDQFKRVLKELVEKTDTAYIQEETMKKVIRKERYLTYSNGDMNHSPLNLNNTLETINREIIEHILNEEKGNQKATASRLGISRTTLWRILQKQ